MILSGSFLAKHKQEIVELARNTEKAEREEHPLQRIMDIKEDGDTVVITTTDLHLPQRVGHAIVDAYKGDLDTHYDREGYFAASGGSEIKKSACRGRSPGCRLQPLMQIIGASLATFLASPAASVASTTAPTSL